VVPCPCGADTCRGRRSDRGSTGVSPWDGHTSRTPVAPGWKVRARTGTYGLIPRRRSGTRLPWSQGRLCPSRRDSAARRRGPAVIRFFIPGFSGVNHRRSGGLRRWFPHKTHERKKRYAAGARRRVSFTSGQHHRRPCDLGSLVLHRRRGMSPYVPVRAGTFNPQPDRQPPTRVRPTRTPRRTLRRTAPSRAPAAASPDNHISRDTASPPSSAAHHPGCRPAHAGPPGCSRSPGELVALSHQNPYDGREGG
jgi:hypothetical protein